jgi:hypothetical protein
MVYTLKEMEEAADGFSDKKLIGVGGFGRVYKGILKDGEVRKKLCFEFLFIQKKICYTFSRYPYGTVFCA